jgi:hypothetical protein
MALCSALVISPSCGQLLHQSTPIFPVPRTVRCQCGTCALIFAVCPQASGRCMICGFSQEGTAQQKFETPICFCQSFYKVIGAQLVQHILEECFICGVCYCWLSNGLGILSSKRNIYDILKVFGDWAKRNMSTGLPSATGRLHCGWIPKSKFKRSCAFRLAWGRREGSLNDGSSKHIYGGALFVNDQIIQGTNISERRGIHWRILLLCAVGCVCLGIP